MLQRDWNQSMLLSRPRPDVARCTGKKCVGVKGRIRGREFDRSDTTPYFERGGAVQCVPNATLLVESVPHLVNFSTTSKPCTLDVEVHIGQNLHVGECGAPLLGELHGLEDTAVADGRTAAGYVGCEVDRFKHLTNDNVYENTRYTSALVRLPRSRPDPSPTPFSNFVHAQPQQPQRPEPQPNCSTRSSLLFFLVFVLSCARGYSQS